MALLGFDQTVGEIGDRSHFLLNGLFFVFPINLILLVMGVKQIDGKAAQMIEIVLAGIGNAAIGLLIGYIAGHHADHNKGQQHQGQHDHLQFPTQRQTGKIAGKPGRHSNFDPFTNRRRPMPIRPWRSPVPTMQRCKQGARITLGGGSDKPADVPILASRQTKKRAPPTWRSPYSLKKQPTTLKSTFSGP